MKGFLMKRIITIALLTILCAVPAFAQSSNATVYIYRIKESGWYAKTETAIYCDDVKIARIGHGQFFILALEPGKHRLAARDKKELALDLDFKPGETYYIRADMDLTRLRMFRKPNFRLSRIDTEQGTSDVKQTKPISAGDIKDKRVSAKEPMQ
jgi:hypothetical protein